MVMAHPVRPPFATENHSEVERPAVIRELIELAHWIRGGPYTFEDAVEIASAIEDRIQQLKGKNRITVKRSPRRTPGCD
jgi:hypothetical protein